MKAGAIIDIDGHVVLEGLSDWQRYFPKKEAEEIERGLMSERNHPSDKGTSKEAVYRSIRERQKGLGGWDPEARLKDMDSEGYDVSVVFPSAIGLKADVYSPDFCRGYNTWLHEFCQRNPARLKGIAAVPLADADAARKELRRAVTELGFVGMYMKPTVGEKRANHSSFHPIYAEAEALNVPVMYHVPHGAYQVLRRSFGYDFLTMHATVHPVSMMLALADVIYGGLAQKFPKLRFGFMEGQVGWAPWFVWRLDEQYETYAGRPNLPVALDKPPSEYVREGRFFFSCDPEEKFLAHAAAHLGDDCIVWASDYPHSDAVFPGALKAFLDQDGLTAAQKHKILRQNPIALLHGPAAA